MAEQTNNKFQRKLKYIQKIKVYWEIIEAFISKTVVQTSDDKAIERECSESSKEEAAAKDDTDGGEAERENLGGSQSKEAADGNVADH